MWQWFGKEGGRVAQSGAIVWGSQAQQQGQVALQGAAAKGGADGHGGVLAFAAAPCNPTCSCFAATDRRGCPRGKVLLGG